MPACVGNEMTVGFRRLMDFQGMSDDRAHHTQEPYGPLVLDSRAIESLHPERANWLLVQYDGQADITQLFAVQSRMPQCRLPETGVVTRSRHDDWSSCAGHIGRNVFPDEVVNVSSHDRRGNGDVTRQRIEQRNRAATGTTGSAQRLEDFQ